MRGHRDRIHMKVLQIEIGLTAFLLATGRRLSNIRKQSNVRNDSETGTRWPRGGYTSTH